MPLGLDFTQIFLHMFNVVLLFGGLYFLLYGPVCKFMQEREDHYRQMDEEKEKSLEEAQQFRETYENKLAQVEDEILDRKRELSAELDHYRQMKKSQIDDEAKRILDKACQDAEKKKEAILEGTKEDIAGLIDEAADKLLLNGTTEDFYNAFLDEAERSVDNV